jgi:hypothetical protein
MSDPRETTRAATIAQLARFDRLVDPEGKLPPDERARRSRAALRSYMSALSLRASQAKRKKNPPAVEKPGGFEEHRRGSANDPRAA